MLHEVHRQARYRAATYLAWRGWIYPPAHAPCLCLIRAGQAGSWNELEAGTSWKLELFTRETSWKLEV